jgi:hypothetical protein
MSDLDGALSTADAESFEFPGQREVCRLHSHGAMCMWRDSLDGRPGIAADTRILSDATVLVILPISWGSSPRDRARLVLRCDRDGNISAALQRDSIPCEPSDDHPI